MHLSETSGLVLTGGSAAFLVVLSVALCAKHWKRSQTGSTKSQSEKMISDTPDVEQGAAKDAQLRDPAETACSNSEEDGDNEIELYWKMEVQEELMKLDKQQYALVERMASGSFCEIHRAIIRKGKQTMSVAAKMLKSNTEQNRRLFTARLNFISQEITRHVNILSLIAVDTNASVMFLDLCEGGTMSSWVKALERFTPETDELLIRFSLDIAKGLKHLHSLKVLHRRLGIRNILLKHTPVRLIVKLSGFGPVESEGSTRENKIPCKWLPPESIERQHGKLRVYNEAVDMWSYGVTLWEMYSRGETPYKDFKIWQLLPSLLNGDRLPCPKECLQPMYDKIMMKCWALDPSQRPSASKICSILPPLFLGENNKDYFYATGQAADEQIDFYAYSDNIYQNNPHDPNNQDDGYLEVAASHYLPMNGSAPPSKAFSNANAKKDSNYLQVI